MSTAERHAERRQMLLSAAFELLGTEGWSATTVRAVVQRADLNPRYFYESFDDLDSLIVAVYDHVVAELRAVVLDAIERSADDAQVQTRAVVSAIVGFVDEDRRRGRVLYVEGLGNEALNVRRMEAGGAVVAFIERFAEDRGASPRSDEHVGRVGAAFIVGGLSQMLIDWLSGRVQVSRAQLIEDATELLLAIGAAASNIADRRYGTTRILQ